MKLILHELKTELRHWWWLVLLLWLLGSAELAYQMDWWGSTAIGPNETRYDNGSGVFTYFMQIVIWLILAMFPVFLFGSISPSRHTSAMRVRPVRNGQRILARIGVLILAVGLPWCLHEAIFVYFAAGKSIGFTLWACGEAAFSIFLYCSCFALLAWHSRSPWSALMIIGVSLTVTTIASLEIVNDSSLFAFVDEFTTNAYGNLMQIETSFPSLVLLIFVPVIGWVIGSIWNQRTGGFSRKWKQWAPFLLSCFLAYPLHQLAISLIQKGIQSMGRDPALVEKIEAKSSFEIDTINGSFQRFPSEENKPHWRFEITPNGIPTGIDPVLRWAKGNWNWDSGESIHFRKRHYLGFLHSAQIDSREMRYFLDKLPKGKTGVPQILTLRGLNDEESVPLYSDLEQSKSAPSTLPNDADALCAIDFWKIGDWTSLSLDGEKHKFGTLGSAKFIRWQLVNNETVLVFQAHPEKLFTDWKNGIKSRRWFGLMNRERNEFLTVYHGPSARNEKRASYSAAPLVEFSLNLEIPFAFSKTVSDQKWLEQAELFMIEAEFVGQNIQTLYTDRIPKSSSRYLAVKNYRHAKNISSTEKEKIRNRFQSIPANLSEKKFRKWMYDLNLFTGNKGIPLIWNQQLKEPVLRVKNVAIAHKPLLREIIQSHIRLEPAFSEIWTDEDQGWLISLLSANKDSRNPSFLEDRLAKRGLLDDRPKLVKEIIARTNGLAHATSDILQVAEKQGINGVAGIRFSRQLWEELRTVDGKIPQSSRSRFPHEWEELEGFVKNRWRANKWKLPLTISNAHGANLEIWFQGIYISRLTGDEKPIRELLSFAARDSLAAKSHRTLIQTNGMAAVTDEPWSLLARTLGGNQQSQSIPRAKRSQLAKAWQDKKWKYQPETMTFKILDTIK